MRISNNNASLFFEGVVEDRKNDPLKLGRVKVRVFGFHSDSVSDLPTEDLHWASVVMPVTSASVSGVGSTPALVEGSHVIGYFRDGENRQDPVILGSILGIPIAQTHAGGKGGFTDPNKVYPKKDHLNEPDTNRLARGEKTGTGLVARKKPFEGQPAEFKTPTGTGKFPDPEANFGPAYPFNKVIETEAGHVIELDDTQGKERVSVTHKSGTYIEMLPDGSIVIRSIKDTVNLVGGSSTQYSKGVYTLSIDATGNIYCKGDYTFKTEGNMKFDVGQDVVWNIKGNLTQVVGKTSSLSATEDSNISAKNINATGSSATTIKGGGTTAKLNTNYDLATGTYTVKASSADFKL